MSMCTSALHPLSSMKNNVDTRINNADIRVNVINNMLIFTNIASRHNRGQNL